MNVNQYQTGDKKSFLWLPHVACSGRPTEHLIPLVNKLYSMLVEHTLQHSIKILHHSIISRVVSLVVCSGAQLGGA